MADETDWQLQNSAQAIEFAKECVRTAVLTNGGAAVALLAFLGSDAAQKRIVSEDIRWGLTVFSVGVALGVLAGICGYAAQTCFSLDNKRRAEGGHPPETGSKIWSSCGVSAVVLSAACFICGIRWAGMGMFPP